MAEAELMEMTPSTPLVIKSIFDIPGCKFLPTKLVLDPSLDFNHWERIGKVLQDMEESVQWWLGDWLVFGEHTYGEKYAQAVKATGFAEQTLKNTAFVASRFDESRRRDLPFAYHSEVAALEPDLQDKVLDEAVDKKWRRKQVRTAAGVVREEKQCEKEDRFFDANFEAIRVRWQPIRAAILEFANQEAPMFLVESDMYTGDLDEWLQLGKAKPEEYIIARVHRGAKTWEGLQQATGYLMANLEKLVKQLCDDKKLKIVPKGGKTDVARGAVEDVIALFDDPVGLDFRYKNWKPDDEDDEE